MARASKFIKHHGHEFFLHLALFAAFDEELRHGQDAGVRHVCAGAGGSGNWRNLKD